MFDLVNIDFDSLSYLKIWLIVSKKFSETFHILICFTLYSYIIYNLMW